ncbi:MAG: glycogen debranching enzyme, partial [Cyanobacteria bacterium P01_A01_bin.105]
AVRSQQQRNLLTTLFLSKGVPMLLGGDEFSRTQHGNNNTYCQDNEIAWFDWNLEGDSENLPQRQTLFTFTQQLIHFRKQHPIFCRRRWFEGRVDACAVDIGWFTAHGTELLAKDWDSRTAKTVTIFLNGDELNTLDEQGKPIQDDSFLLCFNATGKQQTFTIPQTSQMNTDSRPGWRTVLDTKLPEGFVAEPVTYYADQTLPLAARAIVMLQCANGRPETSETAD